MKTTTDFPPEREPSIQVEEFTTEMADACQADLDSYISFITSFYADRDVVCTVTGP